MEEKPKEGSESVRLRAFLFVFEVEPMEIGKTYSSLPLHCTLMNWFRTEIELEKMIAAAKEIFNDTHSVELKSDHPELFGPENTIPVHLVTKNDDLAELHSKLLDALDRIGVQHSQPAYVGQGWRPHVTTHEGRALLPGEQKHSSAVYLVEALDALNLTNKKVLARFQLC